MARWNGLNHWAWVSLTACRRAAQLIVWFTVVLVFPSVAHYISAPDAFCLFFFSSRLCCGSKGAGQCRISNLSDANRKKSYRFSLMCDRNIFKLYRPTIICWSLCLFNVQVHIITSSEEKASTPLMKNPLSWKETSGLKSSAFFLQPANNILKNMRSKPLFLARMCIQRFIYWFLFSF